VSLVKDKDFETVSRRSKEGAFSKITGVVDTVVRSCVDLNNI
jgi:hypothetical protein